MSAGKLSKKEDQEVETDLTGTVIRKKFAQGSKSEYDAVCLITAKGTFILRRIGANAFYDEKLHALIGKEITARGRIKKPYFIIREFQKEK